MLHFTVHPNNLVQPTPPATIKICALELLTWSLWDRATSQIQYECRVSARLRFGSNQHVEGRSASCSGPIAELAPPDCDDVPARTILLLFRRPLLFQVMLVLRAAIFDCWAIELFLGMRNSSLERNIRRMHPQHSDSLYLPGRLRLKSTEIDTAFLFVPMYGLNRLNNIIYNNNSFKISVLLNNVLNRCVFFLRWENNSEWASHKSVNKLFNKSHMQSRSEMNKKRY